MTPTVVLQGGVGRITAGGGRVALTTSEKLALGGQEDAVRVIERLLIRDSGWRPSAKELQRHVRALLCMV